MRRAMMTLVDEWTCVRWFAWLEQLALTTVVFVLVELSGVAWTCMDYLGFRPSQALSAATQIC